MPELASCPLNYPGVKPQWAQLSYGLIGWNWIEGFANIQMLPVHSTAFLHNICDLVKKGSPPQ